MNFIDRFLNNITMYRLVLYVLLGLLGVAFVLSFFHILPFTPFTLLLNTVYLVAVCWIANAIMATFFQVPANTESVYISALILALIITPQGIQNIGFATFAAILTIVSKFVINLNRKHIFNPVAFGVWLGGLITSQYASWWVGTPSLMPFVLLGGLLIVRKIRREDMVFTFFVVALLTIVFFSGSSINIVSTLQKVFLETPLFFFAFVMLTEPLTTPPTKNLQILYAGIVGFFFSPQIHFGPIYSTPELALLLGNVFSYIVSSKTRLLLTLQQKIQVAPDIYNFVFAHSQKLAFAPGQYMEWTLSHPHTDTRGNRRYFTIASSPTEKDMILGVRFNPNGSSFKNSLYNLQDGSQIFAGQLAGDFVLPSDKNKKIVFIAGGIGVTPFRSMVKYLLDTEEKRDIVLLYTARTIDGFAYKDIFDQASQKIGLKIVYTLTDVSSVPNNWNGEKGRIDESMIQRAVPDFKERSFYLSGPNTMVETYEKMLKALGVSSGHIKKDYFPGFA